MHKCTVAIFWLLLGLLPGCNNVQTYNDQLVAAEQYMQKHINFLDANGLYYQLDSSLDAMYPLAQQNDFLLLNYYRSKMGNSVHLDQLDVGILYADSMEQVYRRCPDVFRQKFEETYIDALCQKGNFLLAQKKYYQAYDLFAAVTQWNDEHKRPNVNNSIFSSIAIGCYQQKLYDKALMYFQLQLNNLLPLTASAGLPVREGFYYTQQVYSNIGLCYTKLNNVDSANFFYQKALFYIDSFQQHMPDTAIVHVSDYAACKAVVYGNLAKVFVLKKEYGRAIDTYRQAIYLSLYDPAGAAIIRDSTDAALSLIQLGEVYKISGAVEPLQQTLLELERWMPRVAHGLGNIDRVKLGWLKMNSWTSQLQGDETAALHYMQQFVQLNDSLQTIEETMNERNLLQVLELRNKEDEVLALQYRNRLSTLYNWFIIAFACIVALAAFMFYRNSRYQKKVNTLLKNLNSEIRQRQKETQFAFEQMESMGQEKDRILTVVAHDLRNPLSGIATLSDILLDDEHEVDSRAAAEAISRASKRSMKTVNELLHSATGQVGAVHRHPVSLTGLIKELVLLFSYRATEKKITLTTQLPAWDIVLPADAAKIERVLGNLLHNAIKFTNNGGQIHLQLKQEDNNVVITIADNGIGMSEKVLASLANAQASIKREGTGGEQSYGLGWDISRQIIEAHGGTLLASSIENEGTTIAIVFNQPATTP